MDFVVQGVITQVMQPNQGVSQKSGQPWQSQEFVLTYEQGQYPKSLCFRVFGADKLQQFAIQQNETITAHLNITCQQSRNGGYFNSIDCWKVERGQMMQQQGYQMPMQQNPFPQQGQQFANVPTPQQYQQTAQAPATQMPQQQQMPFPPAQ